MTAHRSRRRLAAARVALAAVVALTATACGGGSGSTSGASGDENSGAGSSATRTVRTAMGEVKVPENPKRVVVLDTAELDSAITLGVKPVGATSAGTESGFLSYLTPRQTRGIKNVGEIANPDLEAIAALEPDLILSNETRDADRYDELSAIAPTVLTETTGHPWKENFQVHAQALGKTAEAKKVTAAYGEHADRVTEALGGPEKAKETEVSMVRFVEGADIRLYANQTYIGTILKDIGVGRPAIADKDTFSVDVSPEQIDKADGDAVFYATYGDAKKAKESETVGSSLWKDLDAVKRGNVFKVEDELWYQGIGYTAADKILDGLKANLTG
ncbi:iron-siderophore ABC transporter substrate-binding protein [Streptomyces thermolineatus]|uniref:Iron-siderophore ABC transporter substrate-binding protein n=1 Tax=Streptomyces thermolineatus TaxID=44033 RepID=A0ABP5YZD6_9ACTN